MIFDRQFFMKTVAGDYDSLMSTATLPSEAALKDGPQDVRLYVATHSGQQSTILASGSLSVVLPQNYTNASQLFVLALVTGTVKIVSTAVGRASSTVLIKGTTAKPGIFSTTDRMNAITISNPDSVNNATVEYMLVPLPDLTLASSYFGGNVILGYNNNQ